MLTWAIILLSAALVAVGVSFGGIPPLPARVARIAFAVLLLGSVTLFVLQIIRVSTGGWGV